MSRGSSVEIEIQARAPEGWDAFVEGDAAGTFCHLAGWGRVMEDVFGHEPLYLTAHEGEDLRGVLPLVRMPALVPGRHVLVSMPYLNYGGPLGDDETRSALSAAALAEAERGGDRLLELRNRTPLPDPPERLAPGREKITLVLDLPEERDTLFKDRFRSKLRSQIRRPTKDGMETAFGPEWVEGFWTVFSENMRDLGTPVLPLAFFRKLAETFPERVDFGVVLHEGDPVAAGCGFHLGGEFEMTWASSLRAYNRSSPNMLLYWGFMERCIDAGRTAFNFGRCTPGSGTHRFKSQWGSEDEPLAWLAWPEDRSAPDPDADAFGLATRVWSRLPLPVANRLGPVLARRIPTF